MRLGDFRKETADLSDDYILDNVMFIEDLPGNYDGHPIEYKDHKAIYTNQDNIRFYIFDSRIMFWDYCDEHKSYEENLELYLSNFVRGEKVSNERWESYLIIQRKQFDIYWNEIEWQEYRLGIVKNESK